MPLNIVIILSLVYTVFVLLTWHIVGLFLDRSLDQRLEMIRSELPDDPLDMERVQFKGVFERFLAPFVKWSIPATDIETSTFRLLLTQAGFRSNTSVVVFYGLKSLLPFVLIVPIVLGILIFDANMSFVSLATIILLTSAFGYYAPDIFLRRRVAVRQKEIFENFPDALDLIRVCVSAGLGLDSAIARVGQLIGTQSKYLAQDFKLLSLELRAGVPKSKALRSLALRTGLEEINALVSMLIQADKFGTSVSESLRVHSESLRAKRKRVAQGAAGKVPAKLTVPMMLCILPALFIVILGPAIIDVMNAF